MVDGKISRSEGLPVGKGDAEKGWELPDLPAEEIYRAAKPPSEISVGKTLVPEPVTFEAAKPSTPVNSHPGEIIDVGEKPESSRDDAGNWLTEQQAFEFLLEAEDPQE